MTAHTQATGVVTGLLDRFDVDVQNALLIASRETVSDTVDQYEDITRDWSRENQFKSRVDVVNTPRLIIITLRNTGSKIFGYVDRGTKGPYPIPKFGPLPQGQMLRFRTGYQPKTRPTAKYRVGPGQAFGPWVSKDRVLHPGIKARKFTITILEDVPILFARNWVIQVRQLKQKWS